MANVNDTDTFLVNRSNSSYQLQAQNLMAELLDDDLMLVNRNGKSYKATGADIKASLKPPAEVLKPQILAPADGAGTSAIPVTDEIISKDNAVKATTYEFKRSDNVGQDWDSPLPPQRYNGATLVQSNIPVGTAPTSGNSSFRYAYFDLGTISAMTFGRVSPDGVCEAKLWGTNDPTDASAWEFIGVGNSTDGRRRVTGYGYRYYCYTARYTSQTTLIQMQTNTHYAVASSIEALTFKTDKDLSLLNVADTLTDNATSATGEITRIDVASNTVTLDGIVGTFNVGDTCSGEEVPSADAAPDPSGVNFVGSTFASSDGSLTAASADWQVAELADTGYTSPISQVTGHPEMTPAPEWTSDALEGATEYRARTKYYAASGEESAWSDDVTFKTAKKGIAVESTPGYIYKVNETSKVLLEGDIKAIDIATSTYMWAVGLDGNLYYKELTGVEAELGTGTPTLTKFDGLGTNLKSVWCSYQNTPFTVTLDKDGVVRSNYANGGGINTGSVVPTPGGVPIRRFMSLGGVSRVVLMEDYDGNFYSYAISSGAIVGTFSCTEGIIQDISIRIPGGIRVLDVAGITGSYSPAALLILGEDGSLWTSNSTTYSSTALSSGFTQLGFSKGGTNTSPLSFPTGGKFFVNISTAATSYESYNGVSGVTDDGELWAACGINAKIFYSSSTPVAWRKIADNVRDCIIANYGSDGYAYLGTDGQYYYAKNTSFLNASPGPVQPQKTQWTTFGSTPAGFNSLGGLNRSFIIIPE